MAELPRIDDIAELLPHDRPMMLLDKLLDANESSLCCGLVVRNDGLFDDGDSVPAYLGLEYMAQTIAAYSGVQAYYRGEPPKIGFLLGTRNFSSNCSRIPCGATLTIEAKRVVQAASGMASFECTVQGENIQQQARLSVYEPANTNQ
ncbi:MAG: hypothetical protein ACK5ME_07210 [Parahaliea sp.]